MGIHGENCTHESKTVYFYNDLGPNAAATIREWMDDSGFREVSAELEAEFLVRPFKDPQDEWRDFWIGRTAWFGWEGQSNGPTPADCLKQQLDMAIGSKTQN
jgi:hypothetical protein